MTVQSDTRDHRLHCASINVSSSAYKNLDVFEYNKVENPHNGPSAKMVYEEGGSMVLMLNGSKISFIFPVAFGPTK